MIENMGGGSQKTPTISVSSSGTITATAGNKTATDTLSSSHDSDFVAANIVSGKTIFGVTGTAFRGHMGAVDGNDSATIFLPTPSKPDVKGFCIYAENLEALADYACDAIAMASETIEADGLVVYYDESEERIAMRTLQTEWEEVDGGLKVTVPAKTFMPDPQFSSETAYSYVVIYK